MDYLKASDMYKAIKIGGEKKPSEVYRIASSEASKGKKAYACLLYTSDAADDSPPV